MTTAQATLTELRDALTWYFARPAEAIALAERAIAAHPGWPVEPAAQGILARSTFVRGRLEEARGHADACLAWYANHPDDADAVGMLLVLGAVERRQGRPAPAVTFARQALDRATALDDVDQIAIAHNNLGLIKLNLSELDAAYGHFNAALDRIDRVSDELKLNLEGSLHNNVGLVMIQRRSTERAFRHFEQAVRLARQAGHPRQEERFLQNLVLQLIKLERFDSAAERLGRLLELVDELGDEGAGRATAWRVQGILARAEGRISEAEEHFARAVDILENVSETRQLGASLQLLAETRARLGDAAGALEVAERAVAFARDKPEAKWIVGCLDLVSELSEQTGDLKRSLEAARLARAMSERLAEAHLEQQLSESQARQDIVWAEQEAKAHRQQTELLEKLVRERTAELSEALERAELADKSKNAFLAIASHELRTPLNAILGYGEMVREELELGVEPAELMDPMDRILDSGRRLLELIQRILAMANLEARAVDVLCEPFDLGELAAELVARVTPFAEARGNAITAEIEDLEPVASDRRLIGEAVWLLLENAAKFTENGAIRVVVARVPDGVSISVADTGIGMDPEAIARVFEPFRQSDESFTRTFGGLGLGLSLCKRYCEVVGGALSVQSELDRGSTFEIRLRA